MAQTSTTSANPTEPLDREPFSLREHEEWWRDRGDMLQRHGYELRPRFQPGWTPSWKNKKTIPTFCEDKHASRHPKTIDARRLSDGKRVKIKKLFKGSKEVEIAKFFSSDVLRSDLRNHCVPILEVFSDESDALEFMVMPLLTTFEVPYFYTVDEAVDFIRQLLEGLTFMHEHNVAHRDCSFLNIMMDGEPLYPKGFHPAVPLLDANGKFASPRRRRSVNGVKYYFTDFGISTRFDGSEKTRLVIGEDGQDQDVPELSEDEPYDPFAVDVFILGNVFRNYFMPSYENLNFLMPLIDSMTRQEPAERPTADAALKQFNEIIQNQTPRSLRWLLILYSDSRVTRLWCTVASLSHEAALIARKRLSFNKGKVTS